MSLNQVDTYNVTQSSRYLQCHSIKSILTMSLNQVNTYNVTQSSQYLQCHSIKSILTTKGT